MVGTVARVSGSVGDSRPGANRSPASIASAPATPRPTTVRGNRHTTSNDRSSTSWSTSPACGPAQPVVFGPARYSVRSRHTKRNEVTVSDTTSALVRGGTGLTSSR